MRRGKSHSSPTSGDEHNNHGDTTATSSVPSEEESQRGFNVQHSGTKGDSAVTEANSRVHFGHDEDYDYYHHGHSSPLRGIAR